MVMIAVRRNVVQCTMVLCGLQILPRNIRENAEWFGLVLMLLLGCWITGRLRCCRRVSPVLLLCPLERCPESKHIFGAKHLFSSPRQYVL